MSIARKASVSTGKLIAEYIHGESITPWAARYHVNYSVTDTAYDAPYNTAHARIWGVTGGGVVTPWATYPFNVVSGKTYRFEWEAASCESGQGTRIQIATVIGDDIAFNTGTDLINPSWDVIGIAGGTSQAVWANTEGTTTLYFFAQPNTQQITAGVDGAIGIWTLRIYEIN